MNHASSYQNFEISTQRPRTRAGVQYSQRHRARWLLCAVLLGLMLGLGGCGNKGPLKLPENSAQYR